MHYSPQSEVTEGSMRIWANVSISTTSENYMRTEKFLSLSKYLTRMTILILHADIEEKSRDLNFPADWAGMRLGTVIN